MARLDHYPYADFNFILAMDILWSLEYIYYDNIWNIICYDHLCHAAIDIREVERPMIRTRQADLSYPWQRIPSYHGIYRVFRMLGP